MMILLLPFLCTQMEPVLPLPLETPAFGYYFSPGRDEPRLELVSCSSNGVIDYENWFDSLGEDWPSATFHNGGVNDAIRGDSPPGGIPTVLRVPGGDAFHLYQIVNSEDRALAFYGDPPNRFGVVLHPRILAVLSRGTFKTETVLDFLAYAYDPALTTAEEREFTFQALKWAEVKNGILYVSNAHRTYAASSGGSNGFLTAIELSTLEVIWRSSPLVANSENFVLLDDVIITGYGFTAEDDFVYLLDRNTGEILQEVPVPSAPEYFSVSGDSLMVRCYDTDCLFLLTY